MCVGLEKRLACVDGGIVFLVGLQQHSKTRSYAGFARTLLAHSCRSYNRTQFHVTMDTLGKMGGPMNEAQKKLYKKLLKNIEAKDEEDELAQMAAAKETPVRNCCNTNSFTQPA